MAPATAPPRTSQVEFSRKRRSRKALAAAKRRRGNVDDGGPGEDRRDDGHERERRDVDAVEEGRGGARGAQARDERCRERHEDEGGEEDTGRGDEGAGGAGEEPADERGGREDGAGRDLPGGNRVEELRFGEPPEPVDEVGPEEREEDVTASEEDGAGPAEKPEDPGEGGPARRRQTGHAGGEGEEGGEARDGSGRAAVARGARGHDEETAPQQHRQLVDAEGRRGDGRAAEEAERPRTRREGGEPQMAWKTIARMTGLTP